MFPEPTDVVAVRRYLHRHPELSFHEDRTSRELAEVLTMLGYNVQTGIGGGHGIVADLPSGEPGPTLVLRADMDALPVTEENSHDFVSTNKGVMHACGHDANMSIVLATAARLIRDRPPRGDVRILFQPAEEKAPGGARSMLEAGCLEGADAIFGFHMWPDTPAGRIAYRVGPIFAYTLDFVVTYDGVGGHAATPQRTQEPITALAETVLAFNGLPSRRHDARIPLVLSVTHVDVGTSKNILPRTGYLEGTLRTFQLEAQEDMVARLRETVQGIATSHGIVGRIEIRPGYPAVVNSRLLEPLVREVARDIVGEESVDDDLPLVLGGEDFSYFANAIPGFFILLGARNEEKGCTSPLHSPTFRMDEDWLPRYVDYSEALVRRFLETGVPGGGE